MTGWTALAVLGWWLGSGLVVAGLWGWLKAGRDARRDADYEAGMRAWFGDRDGEAVDAWR